jgi:hypothetical protein
MKLIQFIIFMLHFYFLGTYGAAVHEYVMHPDVDVWGLLKHGAWGCRPARPALEVVLEHG